MKVVLNDKIHLLDTNAEQIKQITKQLTIHNPVHTQARNFGRSTYNIDRHIKLFEHTPVGLVLPRGIPLNQFDIEEITDERRVHPVKISTTIQPRDYQQRALNSMLSTAGGVLVAPTGSGKTTIGIELAARLGQRCLILVKSLDLAKQWQSAIKRFTGLDAGLIGGGKWQEGREFTVATVQTLFKHNNSLDYGLIIVDECHNTPANQAFHVINHQTAKYRFGLSATPQRRDNLEAMIFAAIGPIVAEILSDEVDGAVLPVTVSKLDYQFAGDPDSWIDFISLLGADDARNQIIVEKAIKASQKNGVVILTGTVEHAERITQMIQSHGIDAALIHGQLPKKVRAERMSAAPSCNLIIGTLSLLAEGIDWPHIGCIIFATPVSAAVNKETPAATRLIQSIGRARRPFPGKTRAHVLDIVDIHPLGLSAYKKRTEIYRRQGFTTSALRG